MSGVIFTILSLAFLTAAFLAWYFTHKTREKERLIMLEKGMELPSVSEKKTFRFAFPWLKVGILVTAIAIGLIVAIIISEVSGIRYTFEPVMMLLFGGIGMIIAHYIDRNDK
jgi:hypothetical protein